MPEEGGGCSSHDGARKIKSVYAAYARQFNKKSSSKDEKGRNRIKKGKRR